MNETDRKKNEKETRTVIIRVYGIVQGVGFRPFVSRAADAAGIRGSVANKGSYVEIFARGTETQLAAFHRELEEHPPERSAVLKIDTAEIEDRDYTDFQIIESEKEAGDIFVSPDIATCPKCREELYDPANRRYMHPFINCTACGPRLTILDAMPYDRERTSMADFPMCPDCEYEYTHAETRRYDAQPVCCNDCGPEGYLIGSELRGREAITAVRQAILDGKIVAVKGIGGFHLCCNAENEEAVARLRRLKNRPMKPFAVMMRDLETVRRECELIPEAEPVLDGHEKPIILLKKRKQSRLAPDVAPDNPKVGVMLPYAPLQMLLFDYNDGLEMTTDSFVMTSANASGAPICRTDEDALAELSGMCDLILSHNRKIRIRADDSVMDFYRGRPYMIRRSRGYAPLPFMMSVPYTGSVLAMGGELKNTFCVGKNQLLYPSPYVGDLADLRTVKALEETVRRLETLLETEPEIVACDLHPKYNSVYVAHRQNLPVYEVQHHYAHILSCMAEHDREDPVIGVSFDGTGYGTDGTIWGGEILRADRSSFERLGHIRPFRHVGGDLGVRQGWRIAVSMINDLYGEKAAGIAASLELCSGQEQQLIRRMAEKRINCVDSTSAGRLFDAVSAVTGIRKEATYEGEMSVTLMYRAQAFLEAAMAADPRQIENLRAEIREHGDRQSNMADGEIILPTERLFRRIVDMTLRGEDAGKTAYCFHVGLAEQIVSAVKEARERTGITAAALSGGVFQNLLLLELVDSRLEEEGIQVLRHSLVPPNDGGIALGQALAAMEYLNRKQMA